MAMIDAPSKYQDFISTSNKIQPGPPAVYQLTTKKEKFGSLTRMTVGEKDVKKTNKTILLVGEKGTGKSTLINALVNYSMGVEWEDGVWFHIVEEKEKEKRSPLESQTSDAMVYQMFGFEGKTLPYSLTIIDTPGFGDTRGIEHDVLISQRLLDLFRSEDGVQEVHAVGLVMKGSDNRLSDRLMYVFNSVTSLFGTNMEKNIVALITHSNGKKPKNVFQAVEAANIKCSRDEKNQPVYYLFDNCQHEDRTEEEEDVLKVQYLRSQRGMKQFTSFLEKTGPQKLEKTVEVLNNRIRLAACIQSLQDRISLIELKQTEIRQIQEALKKHEEEMKKDQKVDEDTKEEYERRKTESQSRSSLLENLEEEKKKLTAERSQLLDEAYQHVVKLEEIALNVVSVSTYVHLDFLIKKMKGEGDKEKVQKLEEMKSREDEGSRSALQYLVGRLEDEKNKDKK